MTLEIKTFDEPKMVRADQIRLGDMLDLEDDAFADPPPAKRRKRSSNHVVFECELQTVDYVLRETPECVAIGIEGIDVFGFPVDHELKVMGFNPNYMSLDMAVERFRETPNAENADYLRAIATEYADDGIIEDDTRDGYLAEIAPHLESK